VFLPGLIAILFLIAWWAVTGDLASKWTFAAIPALTIASVENIITNLDARLGIGVAIPTLIASYFLGSALVWTSRSGTPAKEANRLYLMWMAMTLKIPKPEHAYDPNLQPLMDAVSKRLGEASPLAWRLFYPVVKSYLSRNLAQSLVSTYQNKYTFHRSIVMAAAILFWLCVATVVGGLVTHRVNGAVPHWAWLSALMAASLIMVLGFSGSYRMHWQMFDNTIITEAYSLICVTHDERSSAGKSNSN
jgi:hypothetical protein